MPKGIEKDNDFAIYLVEPGVAKAECRTGRYLSYVCYDQNGDSVQALVQAFEWARLCVSRVLPDQEGVAQHFEKVCSEG